MPLAEQLEIALNYALESLDGCLTATSVTANGDTHKVLTVSGWQADEAIESLAMYLVMVHAGVTNHASQLCLDLINDPRDFTNDLSYSVNQIISQPADSGETAAAWKSTWRNPWIAEGIWHCCMTLAMRKPELHAHGTVIAVNLPHVAPKDHGLDVTAIYVKNNGELGMSFVETKAYKNDPNKAISDAVSMFNAIEAGKHNNRLRQLVTTVRSMIEEPHKSRLSTSLWKDERVLIPNPHYESVDARVHWHHQRNIFQDLKAPVVIMPHPITGFDDYFDRVADQMRLKSQEVAAYV